MLCLFESSFDAEDRLFVVVVVVVIVVVVGVVFFVVVDKTIGVLSASCREE